MKKCHMCAEEIQDEAIKCKHCGEIINNKHNFKDVKKGIKRAEFDKISYNMKVFFSILAGIFIGCIIGSIAGSTWGWITGIVSMLFFSVKSANTYFELKK